MIEILDEVVKLLQIDPKNIESFIEIGCLWGEDSVKYADYFPNATVYIFEANPNYDVFVKHTIKDQPRIKFWNQAVLNYKGTTLFCPVDNKRCGNRGISSIFRFDTKTEFASLARKGRYVSEPAVYVPCIDINTWAAENGIDRLDIAEIDVQGAELYVIQGMSDLLTNMMAIIIEENIKKYYIGQPDFSEVHELLVSFGFKKVKDFGSNGWDKTSLYINEGIVN